MVMVGIAGIALFGWQLYSDKVTPPRPPLLESAKSYFKGYPAKVQAVPMRWGFVNYRIWLVDQPVAFQQLVDTKSGGFDRQAFDNIDPNSELVIGVVSASIDRPGIDRRTHQKFLGFVSLESDKKQISSLADYNRKMESARDSGMLFPVLLAASAITLGNGIWMLGKKHD